ncbi:MAG: hypothetical protein WC455_22455 [Dehalococcoidia bacterium]|jgi:hypothetical protein
MIIYVEVTKSVESVSVIQDVVYVDVSALPGSDAYADSAAASLSVVASGNLSQATSKVDSNSTLDSSALSTLTTTISKTTSLSTTVSTLASQTASIGTENSSLESKTESLSTLGSSNLSKTTSLSTVESELTSKATSNATDISTNTSAVSSLGTEAALLDIGVIHATFKSPAASTGIFHAFGFYEAPAAHVVLTNASATQTLGSANNLYMANVFIVAKEAGTVSGGTTGTAKITITGTSITAAGVRTASDAEILVADITALAANTFIESTKMWIGQVTLTIAATGDHTVFSATVNYGIASVHHFFERDVIIQQVEITGRAGAADSGFNLQLLKHSDAGWTYSAGAFVAGGTVLLDMAVDLNTEKNLVSGKRFHYHRKGLTDAIQGLTADEGIVLRITTSANNAIESMDARVQVKWA